MVADRDLLTKLHNIAHLEGLWQRAEEHMRKTGINNQNSVMNLREQGAIICKPIYSREAGCEW